MNNSSLTWILFGVSIIVLFVIPFLAEFLKRGSTKFPLIGKILNWTLAAVVVFHLLPEVIGVAGYPAAVLALTGFLLALGLDSLGSRINAWRFIPAVVFIGLSLHGFLDGFAIDLSNKSMILGVGEVVVFHRVFAGLFIWQVCVENYSKKVAASILGLLGLATIAGFFFGADLLKNTSVYLNIAYIQAFIIGGILHVAFHRDVTKGA